MTVAAAGTLVLNVDAIAGDNRVNIAEKAAGFSISGDTGSEGGVSVTVTVLEHCCGGPAAIHAGPYTGAKIAYQSFPDMARLRWLGIVGPDGLEADNGRAPSLRRTSSGSTVESPLSV